LEKYAGRVHQSIYVAELSSSECDACCPALWAPDVQFHAACTAIQLTDQFGCFLLSPVSDND
jgi:hypothetical protein